MSRPSAVRLGPFVGGMNAASDPSYISDSEMVDCVNFEVDIDGSLVGRPPITSATDDSAVWTERIVIIGRATLAGVNYLIGSNSDGTYSFRDDTNTWAVIQTGLHSRVALQYRDKVYIVPAGGSGDTGGRWDGTTFTADASMPEGDAAVFHKGRMFICPGVNATTNPSRLSYTDAITADALTWNAALDIVDVSPGDGSNLIDVVIYDDNLMLFKQDSTYVLAFDSQPTDGLLRSINAVLGATSYRCVVQYENSIFCYHEGRVYEIVNYDFSHINIKVPFVFDGTGTRSEEVFLCLVGSRLIVRYYNRIYVFGLLTQTWTRWDSQDTTLINFGPLLDMPSNPTQSVNKKYYGGSSLTANQNMVYVADGYDSATVEGNGTYDILCEMQTKNYDFGDSYNYKKLAWWGADILTDRDVIALLTPTVNDFSVTWEDMLTYDWANFSASPWLTVFGTPLNIETDVTVATALNRKFLKFEKAMRFRQASFYCKIKYNGTTTQGPCRLFTLTAMVGLKQLVSKQVT